MPENREVPITRADIFVTVVAVFDSNVSSAGDIIRRMHEHVSERFQNYELVLVDNGMNGEQLREVRGLLAELSCIRVLRLSRHFTTDTAIFAGLESAIGDYVVVMTPTHDPVEAVAEIVAMNQAGSDIVQGISSVPIGGSLASRIGRSGFYWYNRRFLDVDIPKRATYLTGLTRRAVNSLTATSRNHRYLRHLIRHIGYRLNDYVYTPAEGATRRRTVKAGYMEAIEMVSSYSTHPLRVVTVAGVLAGFLNLLYAIYVVVVRFVVDDVAQGWTTTSLQLSLMFFLICIIIAIQAEYIGRILTETRREPTYFVMEELESETLIADLQRRNVSS